MNRQEIIREWEKIVSRDPLDVPWDLIDETFTVLKEQDASNTDLEMIKQIWLHGYLTYTEYREVERRIIHGYY